MSRSTRHLLPLVVASACWGLGAVASKRAVDELTAPILLVIQLAASAIALLVVSALSGGRILPDRQRLRIGVLGLLNPGLAYMFSLAGLATITAGLSVLLWSLEPILIMVAAWILLGERLSARAFGLSVIAVGGAAVAGAAGTGGADVRGIALTVAGVGCCALYTVITSRLLNDGSTLPLVFLQQVFALGFAIAAFAVYVAVGGNVDLGAVSGAAWASAALSGVVYYGLAFWAFLTGLRCTPVARAAVFLSLIPLFGITAGWLLLAERMTPSQVVGAVVAMAAVLTMVRLRPAESPQVEASAGNAV